MHVYTIVQMTIPAHSTVTLEVVGTGVMVMMTVMTTVMKRTVVS